MIHIEGKKKIKIHKRVKGDVEKILHRYNWIHRIHRGGEKGSGAKVVLENI